MIINKMSWWYCAFDCQEDDGKMEILAFAILVLPFGGVLTLTPKKNDLLRVGFGFGFGGWFGSILSSSIKSANDTPAKQWWWKKLLLQVQGLVSSINPFLLLPLFATWIVCEWVGGWASQSRPPSVCPHLVATRKIFWVWRTTRIFNGIRGRKNGLSIHSWCQRLLGLTTVRIFWPEPTLCISCAHKTTWLYKKCGKFNAKILGNYQSQMPHFSTTHFNKSGSRKS